MDAPSKSELVAADCWFAVDRVKNRPDVTAFKQQARLRQAAWREGLRLPAGTSPYDPSSAKTPEKVRRVGSRIAHDVAWSSKANLMSEAARAAAGQRRDEAQPRQMLNWDRVWCDLLSSMPLCFNLFGPVSVDLALAQRAVNTWFPEAPGTVEDVILEWSPERRTDRYLRNGTAFDAAVILRLPDGKRGVIGIETKYHEHLGPDEVPESSRLAHYRAIADKSEAFARGSVDRLVGAPLQQIWQDHLLTQSMLLQADEDWGWARFVLVYPSRNPSFAEGVQQYAALLAKPESFQPRTLESLLGAQALPEVDASALKDRYIW